MRVLQNGHFILEKAACKTDVVALLSSYNLEITGLHLPSQCQLSQTDDGRQASLLRMIDRSIIMKVCSICIEGVIGVIWCICPVLLHPFFITELHCTCLTHLPLDKMAALFPDDIFRCIFAKEKFCILIKISLKFVPKGSIDNTPALV